MADPEVLHTNPNVPQDEDGTGSEALFAGLNDEHVIIVEALSLVGNSEIVDGPAETIHPIPPLYIPPGSRTLVIDEGVVATRAYVDAAIAALALQVTANTNAIATNTTAIATNTTAIATNTSAIATLVSQVSVLQAQVAANSLAIQALRDSIKPSSYIPQLVGSWAGAGNLTVAPRLLAFMALSPMAGAGSLTVNAFNAKFLSASFGGEGSLSVRFTGAPMPVFAGWAGAGSMRVDLTPIRQIYASLAGVGNLAAVNVNALLQPTAQFAGAGSLSVSIQAPTKYIAFWPMAGAGQLSVATLQRMTAVTTMAGAGALTVPVQTLLRTIPMPMVGVGSFNVSETMNWAAAATMAGTGNVSVSTTALLDSGVRALAGTGTLNPVLAQMLLSASTINLAGAGGLGVDLQRYSYLVAALAGAGSLSLDAMIVRGILPAAMAGAGSLSPLALQQLLASGVGLMGVGTLNAIANLALGSGAINLAGSGLLLPTVTGQLVAKPASLAGAGALSPITLYKVLPAPPPFAGHGGLIVNATQQSNFSALDPAHSASTGLAFSNSNRTVTGTSGTYTASGTRGTKSSNSGKKYFEVTLVAIDSYVASTNQSVGLVDSAFGVAASTAPLGYDSPGDSLGLFTSSTVNYPVYLSLAQVAGGAHVAPVPGDVIGVAANFGTGNLSVAFSVNGQWFNGGSPSTTLTTYDVVNWTPTNITIYPAITVSDNTNAAQNTINVGNAAFKYTLPSGFSAWG